MIQVASFPPPSLAAQLAELQRERSDRLTRRDAMDLSSKRATSHEIAHRNNALDGAIKTLEVLVAASGQPGRRELIEALRRARPHISLGSGDAPAVVEQIDAMLARIPT